MNPTSHSTTLNLSLQPCAQKDAQTEPLHHRVFQQEINEEFSQANHNCRLTHFILVLFPSPIIPHKVC